MERLFSSLGSERMRDVLMATVANDEPLRAYVARCLPGVGPAAQNAEYERLKKQRVAAMMRLRAMGPAADAA
jgi:hypothetical protein